MLLGSLEGVWHLSVMLLNQAEACKLLNYFPLLFYFIYIETSAVTLRELLDWMYCGPAGHVHFWGNVSFVEVHLQAALGRAWYLTSWQSWADLSLSEDLRCPQEALVTFMLTTSICNCLARGCPRREVEIGRGWQDICSVAHGDGGAWESGHSAVREISGMLWYTPGTFLVIIHSWYHLKIGLVLLFPLPIKYEC